MLKKFFTMFMSAICLLSMCMTPYAAELPSTGSLTIVKPIKGGSNMTFHVYDLGDYAFYYDSEQYSAALSEVEKQRKEGALDSAIIEEKTESGSSLTFKNLPAYHTYYVRMTDNFNYNMQSFLVTVPYTDDTGNVTYSVIAEPKFEKVPKTYEHSGGGKSKSDTTGPGVVEETTAEETTEATKETTAANETDSTDETKPESGSGSISASDGKNNGRGGDLNGGAGTGSRDKAGSGADPSKYKTGDNFNPILAASFITCGACMMAAGVVVGRRKKEKKAIG